MNQQNKDIARRWVEDMWNQRDQQLSDELIAAEFIEHAHAPFSEAEPGAVAGPQAMRATMDWLVRQFPDLTMTIEAIAADADLVAVRVYSEGTNLGKLNGILPASGKRFGARQTHWLRIQDGKIVEHWATRDDLTTMLQLGVVAKPRLAAFARQVRSAAAHRLRSTRASR